MTPEMNRSNVEIDHVKTIPSFVISKDEGRREALICNKIQPILKKVHQHKELNLTSSDKNYNS